MSQPHSAGALLAGRRLRHEKLSYIDFARNNRPPWGEE
jgi:hypothetical protein